MPGDLHRAKGSARDLLDFHEFLLVSGDIDVRYLEPFGRALCSLEGLCGVLGRGGLESILERLEKGGGGLEAAVIAEMKVTFVEKFVGKSDYFAQ